MTMLRRLAIVATALLTVTDWSQMSMVQLLRHRCRYPIRSICSVSVADARPTHAAMTTIRTIVNSDRQLYPMSFDWALRCLRSPPHCLHSIVSHRCRVLRHPVAPSHTSRRFQCRPSRMPLSYPHQASPRHHRHLRLRSKAKRSRHLLGPFVTMSEPDTRLLTR